MMVAAGWDNFAAPREDNVRPSPLGHDPRACGYNPWRGNVVPGAHGRAMVKTGGTPVCAVCRFQRKYQTHCFLYEVCDRCFSEDPEHVCPTRRETAAQSGTPA